MNAIMVSPPVANGLAWLVNCLLELDVLCFLGTTKNMWTRESGNTSGGTIHKLKPDHDWLRAHLPALSRRKEFAFSPGTTVKWGHGFPRSDRHYDKVILFTRDPRDAMYSMFLRGGAPCPYGEYIQTIQNHTLLPLLDDWIFFHHAWLSSGEVHIVRFEDYKANAVKTLKAALAYLGLNFSDEAVTRAAEQSTHQKAREAEEAYLMQLPGGCTRPSMNRKSTVNDYASHEDSAAAAPGIYRRTAGILARLGYDAAGEHTEDGHAEDSLRDYLPYILLNDFFSSLPDSITGGGTLPLFSSQAATRLTGALVRHLESGSYLRANETAIYKRDAKDLVAAVLAVFDRLLKTDIPESLRTSVLRARRQHL